MSEPNSFRRGPRRIPLRDFFREPQTTGYQVSEDGQTISWLAPYEHRLNLFIQPRGGRARRLTSETERNIPWYTWKGTEWLLFFKDTAGDENFHAWRVRRDGTGQQDLTPFPKVRVDLVDRLWDQPDEVLIQMNRRRADVFDAYRLNVTTGELRLVAENPGTVARWLADHDGRLRAAEKIDGVSTSLLFRESESDEFRVVLTTDFRESIHLQFFTFDNRHLYARSNLGRDKVAIVKLDPATGRELEVLAEHPAVDLGGLSFSRQRRVLTEVRFTTWKTERRFFDTDTERIIRRVEAELPGWEIGGLDNQDRAEETFIIDTSSDRSPGTSWLYDRKDDTLTKLADRAPWLDREELAEMKSIEYRARDGLTIHGYLTLPVGRAPQGLPVVVNPHGGPWARNGWGFNPETQFLANRGYAVLQTNFRGSTGYGRRFWEASFKQWGRKMQDDVTDGARWLIEQGIADPKRLAIYGGSYGGYATLAGVTFTPDLYACGVDYVGVANMFTFMKSIPPYWKPFLEMFYEMVGDPEKDRNLLTQVSPALQADRIKVPMLIVQGANDPRVNKNESDQMVAALRARGIPVEYIVKDNEGHGFANEENRFEFYAAMERFLAAHLHPGRA